MVPLPSDTIFAEPESRRENDFRSWIWRVYVEDLSRAGIFGLALVFAYTQGAFLLVSSIFVLFGKARDPGIALIRFMGALALVIVVLVAHFSETSDIFPVNNLTNSWSLIFIAGSVVMAVVIGELAVYRIADYIDGIFVWMSKNVVSNRLVSGLITYSGTAVVVAVSVLVVVLALPEIKLRDVTALTPVPIQPVNTEVVLEATYSLPGSPMDLVFSGEIEGYITLGQGQILHFELPPEPTGNLQTRVVTSDVDNPRGLAILNDVLYVVDQGELPCPDIRCKSGDLPELDFFEAEAKILKESNGGVFAFEVLSDGALGKKRTILTGLPAANFQHGANGIEVGPDGMLYVSIGGVDALYDKQEILDRIEGPDLEFLGTIIRFNPDGSRVEIFAEGLRNVYGLTFDDEGLLFGVDNDGLTRSGWRREEVLQIKQGANYGYPYEGTFGLHEIRDDSPIWVIYSVGSAGIEWAENIGMRPGLVVGSCNGIRYLGMADDENGRFLESSEDSVVLARISGCVTIIEPGPDQKMIVGVFDTDSLHVFKLVTP